MRVSNVNLKILALDIGSKRIGLAVWNPTARLSRPLPVLQRKILRTDLAKIKKIIDEEAIEAFLVGLPLSLDEKITESTRNSQFWAETLKREFEKEVFLHDESLSTNDAMKLMRESKKKNKDEMKDSIAAALILEDFIRANAS